MRGSTAFRVLLGVPLAMGSVGACAQLIGVQEIPRDAGADAGDAGADHRAPRHDAADGNVGADRAPGDCEAGATRCSEDGLGMETCEDGVWGRRVECPVTAPVCLGSACTCELGAGQCASVQSQQWQRCLPPVDGAAPTWVDVDAACPGTCTLSGCSAQPTSCSVGDAGTHTCGVGQAENCCTSIEVPGGAFDRSYDDFSTGYFSTYYPATVSGFRLDRFEVSIGRFAGFLRALAGVGDAGLDSGATGWRPQPGSGKHAHLSSGQGLRSSSGGYETGWQASWDSHLGYSFVSHQLSSCVNPGLVSFDPTTMEPAPGFTWSSPINCVDWAQAYAFCIWDGGFLPSEAEWNYAASGGAEQRVYPWSVAVDAGPDGGISCNQAVYVSATTQCFVTVQPVGSKSGPGGGDGKWAHADLGGNVLEWTLDAYTSPYPTPCLDCASLPRDVSGDAGTILRVQRGGSFVSSSRDVTTSFRGFSPEGLASYPGGFRCARSP